MTSLTLLADAVVVPEMEGVTTAIVAFIFVCVAYPKLVKNRTQFYGAFTAILVIIFLHSLNVMIGRESAGFQVFAGAMTGLLQLGAIILLFLSCGGLTFKELAGDMARAYEVIRRGEEEKTVIIPIGGDQPKPRQPPSAASPTEAPVERVDLPTEGGWPKKKSDDSGIPLE